VHRDDRRFEFRELLMVPIVKILNRSRGLRRIFIDFGQLVEYVNWAKSRSIDVKFLGTRKNLLRKLFESHEGEICLVLELGVARGALTKWGLKTLMDPNLSWVGFDSFVGLPNDWVRSGQVYLSKGAFSTGGQVPQISDSRLSFVVGDVMATCKQLPELLLNRPDGRVLIIFDLDLFEPSLSAWKEISPHLRHGDLLYFDQAFDTEGERLLLEKYVIKEKSVMLVGTSVIGCVVEII